MEDVVQKIPEVVESIGLTPDVLMVIALAVLGLLAISVFAGAWRALRFAWFVTGIVRKPALALVRFAVLPRSAAAPRERKVRERVVRLPAWAGLELDITPRDADVVIVTARATSPKWERGVTVGRWGMKAAVRKLRREFAIAKQLINEHKPLPEPTDDATLALLTQMVSTWNGLSTNSLKVTSCASGRASSQTPNATLADESKPAAQRPPDARMAKLVGKARHPWKVKAATADGVVIDVPTIGDVTLQRRADPQTGRGSWWNLNDGRPAGKDAAEWLELEWSKAAI